jgi:hypothetical protein
MVARHRSIGRRIGTARNTDWRARGSATAKEHQQDDESAAQQQIEGAQVDASEGVTEGREERAADQPGGRKACKRAPPRVEATGGRRQPLDLRSPRWFRVVGD